VVADRAEIDSAAEELRSYGVDAYAIDVDFSTTEGVDRLCSDIQDRPVDAFRTRVHDPNIPGLVVAFSLPGAFTPTCSNQQCPSFDLAYEKICECGVDDVYCISVNDAFVMFQRGQNLNLKRVKLIPDGSGTFTRRMGMLINKDKLGFGYRSWRYAMVVGDLVIEKWFEEPGINDEGRDEDPYGVTSPETIMDYLLNVANSQRHRNAF